MGDATGAVVVSVPVEKPLVGALLEAGGERFQDFVEDEGGECGGERASLVDSFLHFDDVPGAISHLEENAAWCGV